MRIVGVRVALTEHMEENQRIAPAFWNEVLQDSRFHKICELSNTTPMGVMGITSYQSSEEIL